MRHINQDYINQPNQVRYIVITDWALHNDRGMAFCVCLSKDSAISALKERVDIESKHLVTDNGLTVLEDTEERFVAGIPGAFETNHLLYYIHTAV